MYVSQINSVQFGASSKQMFVSEQQLNLIREIAKKMRSSSAIVESTENSVTASCIGSIATNGCILYNDTFLHEKDENANSGGVGITQMNFVNGSIEVDNQTGKVIKIVNTNATPIESTFQIMDQFLRNLNLNFDTDIVKKNVSRITRLTDMGLQRVKSGQVRIKGDANV